MNLVMLAFVVIAQAQLPATPRDVGEVSPSTRQFMQDAATGGTTEVELGRMAANKAASPQVRAFAERMVKDHAAANDELMELAKQKGVSLSTELDPKHQRPSSIVSGSCRVPSSTASTCRRWSTITRPTSRSSRAK